MKLPNGYGAVLKLSGKRRKPFAVRITVGWTEDGKQLRKYLGYYKTRQEAIKALADYNENPFDLMIQDATFTDVYQRWANVKFKDNPVTGVYIAAYKNLALLHSLRFTDIRKRHIQSVIDSSTLGYQAKSHMKSLCTQLFNFAIDQELVKINFASLVKLPPKTPSELHKPFTPAELDTLWQNKSDIGAKIALILCYTGLRPTELLEMQTANIHLQERYMNGGKKTAASKNRVIPVAQKILPLVAELYNPQLERLDIKDSKGRSVQNYQQLRSLIWDKTPALQNHTPHDGRHTCATLMDDAEIPLKVRQLILGHTATDITNRVYTHKTIQQLIDAIDKI
ncbi:MAG: site-specific integrase [Selenomonadaceae bacterium]|nr:site-specific integrase [Selenomonadaceae bacterium]